MFKKDITVILIIIATVILAVIAVITAVRMRQMATVAPTVPQKKPKAAEKPQATAQCTYSFKVLSGPTLTPTITPRVTLTPTLALTPTVTISPSPIPTSSPTPTLTPQPGPTNTPTPYITDCYTQCESDLNCSHSLVCREDPYRQGQGIKVCLNENCPRERNCWCPGPTSTPTPETSAPTREIAYAQPTTIPTATPTPITIPPVGIVEDAFLGLLAGLSFLTIALLLAF